MVHGVNFQICQHQILLVGYIAWVLLAYTMQEKWTFLSVNLFLVFGPETLKVSALWKYLVARMAAPWAGLLPCGRRISACPAAHMEIEYQCGITSLLEATVKPCCCSWF